MCEAKQRADSSMHWSLCRCETVVFRVIPVCLFDFGEIFFIPVWKLNIMVLFLSTHHLSSRSVQGPDPDTNPDRVGQYNPEHRGRGCNWPGLEFRRGWVQSILLSDAPVCFGPICWLYGSQFDIKSQTMSIEFIYIMPLLVNDRVETTLI